MSATDLYGKPYTGRRTLFSVTTRGTKPTPSAVRDEAFRALLRAITVADHEGVHQSAERAERQPVRDLVRHLHVAIHGVEHVVGVMRAVGLVIFGLAGGNNGIGVAMRAAHQVTAGISVAEGQHGLDLGGRIGDGVGGVVA